PAESFRSSARLRLLRCRFTKSNPSRAPPKPSLLPGGSTRMMSAPQSARWRTHVGPARAKVRSSTRRPVRGSGSTAGSLEAARSSDTDILRRVRSVHGAMIAASRPYRPPSCDGLRQLPQLEVHQAPVGLDPRPPEGLDVLVARARDRSERELSAARTDVEWERIESDAASAGGFQREAHAVVVGAGVAGGDR